jgi:hypothetical protein
MFIDEEDDVLAITNDEEIICRNCMTEDDWDSIEGGSEVITHLDPGATLICDICKRRIELTPKRG